jgi:hypothetical protein
MLKAISTASFQRSNTDLFQASKPTQRVIIALVRRVDFNCKVMRLSRNLLISPFKSSNRLRRVSGASDASKTQSGLLMEGLGSLSAMCGRTSRFKISDKLEEGERAELPAPSFRFTLIELAWMCSPRFCWCDVRLGAQLFFRADPVLHILPRLAAPLGVQLVSSASDVFSRYLFAFDHGNLLGCRHDEQSSPHRVRSADYLPFVATLTLICFGLDSSRLAICSVKIPLR